MSPKITLVTLAALLTAVSVNGEAFARNSTDLNAESGRRPNEVIKSLRKIPSNAFGSIDDPAGTFSGRSSDDILYNSQVVGRDPDRHIRWQILRDR
jgi:hypothetical protein